jgi:hypothetical protein
MTNRDSIIKNTICIGGTNYIYTKSDKKRRYALK